MKNDIAVHVEMVSKDFVLPHEKKNSLKSIFSAFGKKETKTFEHQHALRDISFDIKKGEFFGIVGRNGSGKSTLLKILAGIYQPTKGSVSVSGKLVPFIELGVGFNPELTGRENVFLNGAMLGFTEKEVAAMYDEIVEFAELERFMDQKLKNYSSGMQVRLAFSMATRAEADVLLVDEVLAVGDADFQRKCFDYFRELKRNKKTVIFVSHDMSAVREYCDKVVLIDNSRLVKRGDAEQIAQEYTKLFSSPTSIGQDLNQNVWGSGGVEIKDVKTSKTMYTRDDAMVEIQYTITALQQFEDGFVTGITIKNDTGHAVCGTNSKIIKSKNLRLKPNESKTQTWLVPNIFSDGKYIIEPAVCNAKNMDVCQWVNDALVFQVINEQTTPYVVTPQFTVSTDK